jgi:hypothetical protein
MNAKPWVRWWVCEFIGHAMPNRIDLRVTEGATLYCGRCPRCGYLWPLNAVGTARDV